MSQPDLNLLVALEALLQEGNIARAAKRLRLSPSAMSRTLARLRATTGDPLLVRAGRTLVPSPRALELKARVGAIVEEATSILSPAELLVLKEVERSFTLRTSDGFVESFGPALLARIAADAPGLILHFVQKVTRDSASLRDGTVDLETGVIGGALGPEIRTQALFRDRFVGVVRKGHAFSREEVTVARYTAARHILISRGERDHGPVDAGLGARNQQRRIGSVVTGFSAALALARATDLVATVPERHTASLRTGLHSFALPFRTRELTISLLWHPRMDADPAHRWLREQIRLICTTSG